MPSGRRSGGSHRSGGFSRSGSSGSSLSSSRSSSRMHSSSSFGHRPHHYHRSRTTIYIGGSPYHRGYSSYEDGDSYSSLESAMSSLTPEGQEKLKQINKFEKKRTLPTVLMFFAIPLLIFTLIIYLTGFFLTVNTIKENYDYYHNMITVAEANSDKLIVTGYFDRATKILDSDVEKYYIEYHFYRKSELGSLIEVKGETYSHYDASTALSYKKGDVIKLAVDEYPVSRWTDSVPVHFKDYTYKDDGEYPIAKRNSTIFTIIFIVLGSVVACSGFVFFTISRKIDVLADDLYKHRIQKGTTEENKSSKCKYCGSILKSSDVNCPNCGASNAK